MDELIIKIPNTLKPENLNNFFKYLSELKNEYDEADKIIFDLLDCYYISPAGAVALVVFKDFLKEKKKQTFIRFSKSQKILKYINLFNVFKFEDTIEDVFKKKMSNYTVELSLCSNINECNTVHKNIIQKIVKRTNCKESTRASVDYMLNEIWDNAGVHGYQCYNKTTYPKPIYFCAFSYSNRIEIAIMDRGQGIHNSLKKIEKFRNISSKQALELAIQDGVTGHPTNSPGFGLFSSTELIKGNRGLFFLWSSNRHLLLNEDRISSNRGFLREGTLVVLVINADFESPFEETIKIKTTDEHIEMMDELFNGTYNNN